MPKLRHGVPAGKPADPIRELEARLFEITTRLEQHDHKLKTLPADVAEAVRSTPPEPMLDVKGVAAFLNVSERQVERLISNGAILPVWIGGVRRFSREAIDSYLRAAAKPKRRRRAAK